MSIFVNDRPVCSVPHWIHEELAEAHFHPSDLRLWGNRSWPGFGQVGLAYPTSYEPMPSFQFNRLWWPVWGASRWAYIHLLLTTNQAYSLRHDATGVAGDENNKVHLKIITLGQSSDDKPFESDMYMLPLVPLLTIFPQGDTEDDSVNGLFLCTLVDVRFHLWNVPTPELNIDDTTTWANLWSTINGTLADAFDVSISPFDVIDEDYLQPSRALNLTDEPIPLVIDSAAISMGHRVVFNFDGTIETQTFITASDKSDADQANHTGRKIRAGGDQFEDIL